MLIFFSDRVIIMFDKMIVNIGAIEFSRSYVCLCLFLSAFVSQIMSNLCYMLVVDVALSSSAMSGK